MSLDDVRERVGRYQLDVAYLGDVAVGCTTVRPGAPDDWTATVIACVLPAHRGRRFGQQLHTRALAGAAGA